MQLLVKYQYCHDGFPVAREISSCVIGYQVQTNKRRDHPSYLGLGNHTGMGNRT